MDGATDGNSEELHKAEVAYLRRMVSGRGGVAVAGCGAGPEVDWGSPYRLLSLGDCCMPSVT